MRIDNNNHYYQVYRRSKKKSDDLIEAIERMGVVVAAYEELLENGAYKRITPDGHYGLFKVLKPDIQYVGMLKIVQFDLGDCILPLDG
jgi:hypothetical protein